MSHSCLLTGTTYITDLDESCLDFILVDRSSASLYRGCCTVMNNAQLCVSTRSSCSTSTRQAVMKIPVPSIMLIVFFYKFYSEKCNYNSMTQIKAMVPKVRG